MDGVNYTAYRDYVAGPAWQFVDSRADFNGDGKSDLTIRNSVTGTVELLLMDGVNYTTYRDYNWGTDWQVVETRSDYNGDGKSDLTIRNSVTGNIEVLLMDGVNYTAYRDYVAGPDWQVTGFTPLMLTGTPGHDLLRGGPGNDSLTGLNGNDTLTGGLGSDSFVYQAIIDRGTTGDVITDFTKGTGGDVIKLTELLTSIGAPHNGTAFSAGWINFMASGPNTVIQVDSNGGANSYVTLATLNNVLLAQADTANYVL